MKRLNTRQVDWIARDLIFTWGCMVPHDGMVDGRQADQCKHQAKYMGATWDDALEGRVVKRCEELLPAFERRYGRWGEMTLGPGWRQ